jgi:hypothetical protein
LLRVLRCFSRLYRRGLRLPEGLQQPQNLNVNGDIQSILSHSTVDFQLDTCDVFAIIRREEHGSLGEIERGSEATERDCADQIVLVLVRQELVQTGGDGVTWAQHVEADAAALQIEDPAAGEGSDRSLVAL